jgi:polyribonucleotide nucleotidyltransferase
MEETHVTIDVENDGTVVIGSSSEDAAAKATRMIEALTREVKLGEIYTGQVARITPAGVFVEILPGQDGLVRLRDLADYPVSRAEDVVKIGDDITVMVVEIDRQGRVNLSRRAAITGVMPTPEELARAREEDRPPRRMGGPGGPPRRGDGFGGRGFERSGPPRSAPRSG